MIRFSFFFLSLIASLGTVAQGINFSDKSWAEVLEQANAENKHVFVDAYTTWCGPCKKMDAEVFTDPGVGKQYNKEFISIQLDMEKAGDGKTFAEKYKVRAYPTFMFFDSNGKPLHRALGYHKKDEFIDLAKDAMDPQKQVYALKEKYEENKHFADIALDYAQAASRAGMDTKDVIEQYVSISNEGEWRNPDVWNKIIYLKVPFESKLYKFAADNKDLVESLAEDKDQMESFFEMPQLTFVLKQTNKEEDKMADAMVTINEVLEGRDAEAMVARMEANWFKQNRPEEADIMMAQYLDNFCENANELNSAAWDVVENDSASEEQIDKAIMWVDRAIELEKSYFNLDTKAWLHFRKGELMEAEKIAEEAISLANENDIDASDTETLLVKIKEG